jgi:glutaminyl-tRNA synthetase
LNGLRRRGIRPECLNNFCARVGVTRRGNENVINIAFLEHCIREDLDTIAKRTLVVLDPVPVHIIDLEDGFNLDIDAPLFPKNKELGSHRIHLSKTVYVEREDVLELDHKEHFGMAPGKLSGLKYAFPVFVEKVVVDEKTK